MDNNTLLTQCRSTYRLLFTLITLTFTNPNLYADTNDSFKLSRPTVSSDFPYQSQFVSILDTNIHYIDEGQGNTILFIHGNPTSSYLWRNIIPYVSENHRVVALDLAGMGKSGKLDIDYKFNDHYGYLEKFIQTLNLRDITLVLHDWGAALGFEYARRHEDNIVSIAFMEGVLPPVFPNDYANLPVNVANFFRMIKDPVTGPQFVFEQNGFIEQTIPEMINRPISQQEMDVYRDPYLEISARKPVFVWPQEVPIEGQPLSTVKTLNNIRDFMISTELPILLLYGSPGVLVTETTVSSYINMFDELETVFIGQGFHYIQEDQPEAIGRALADWMRRKIDDD